MQAKRKYMEVAQEKQNLEADRAELQQKYAQKAQQARKLQEMFQKLQQENEMLRSGRANNSSALHGGQFRSSTPPPEANALGDLGAGNLVRPPLKQQGCGNFPDVPQKGGPRAALQFNECHIIGDVPPDCVEGLCDQKEVFWFACAGDHCPPQARLPWPGPSRHEPKRHQPKSAAPWR